MRALIRVCPAWLLVLCGMFAASAAGADAGNSALVVGSKKFTESVILGEIARGRLAMAGIDARHRRELGGTRILWNALLRGDVDVYPEYTGTLRQELLGTSAAAGEAGLRAALAEQGIGMSAPLGFSNNYALGMPASLAARLGIERISALAGHPSLRLGFGNEFLQRADGWPGLRAHYGLPHRPTGLDHDLAYRAVAGGSLDVIDLYSTDAEIDYYDLLVLEDDRDWFTDYAAVYLYRLERFPAGSPARRALDALAGRLPDADIIALNAAVKLNGRSDAAVARQWLAGAFPDMAAAPPDAGRSRVRAFLRNSADHLLLTTVSLAGAIVVAIPLGILAYGFPRAGAWVLSTAGMLQTVPALALLVVMIPPFGIGALPAIVALFLYSILPVLRNTHAGLAGLDPAVRESALALGLGRAARLRHVELPLALPMILAGIKTAAVINVGTATLGALIGAGGYGQPILTGIRLDDMSLILEGAIPAAGLALLVQAGFDAVERRAGGQGRR